MVLKETGPITLLIPLDRPDFEAIFHQDFRQCTCELPMLSKKWNDALGTFVAIRLCCMAKAMEELTGIRLYEVYDFEPRWDWDCEGLHQSIAPDGSVQMVERGRPPEWLLARLLKKGKAVLHLEKYPGRSKSWT